MKNQRLTAILLALLILSTACGKPADEAVTEGPANDDVVETVAETEPEDTRLTPDIPTTGDYGGDEIHFLHWYHDAWEQTVRMNRDIFAAELTGEAINDAVYNRNMLVESSYNVKIVLENMLLGQIDGAVNKAVTSGDDTFDVVYPRLYEAATMFPKGYFVNLHDVPHIDFTKPWWDGNAVETMTVQGVLPAVATSINVNDKDATVAMAFHKEYAAGNDLPDLYQLVTDGGWTMDKLSEFSEIAANDTDGDGEITEADIYGFLGGNDVMDSLYRGHQRQQRQLRL